MNTQVITPSDVKNNLVSLEQIVFEVTTSCNFRCMYCIYSGIYKGIQKLSNDYLTFENAKCVIDYLSIFRSGVAQGDGYEPWALAPLPCTDGRESRDCGCRQKADRQNRCLQAESRKITVERGCHTGKPCLDGTIGNYGHICHNGIWEERRNRMGKGHRHALT